MKMKFQTDTVLSTILPFIQDKNILDIGCVEHSLDRKNKQRIWVHDFLRQNGSSVVGIDILEKDIDTLKRQGYNVFCQNAESFRFDSKFDVIFSGELIEHLSNPGLFLDRVREHLNKGGTFILTTPNCFSFQRFLGIMLGFTNDPFANSEHTLWFSPQVLTELLRRSNFVPEKFIFVNYPIISPNFRFRFIHFFTRFFPKFSETMIVIIKKF